MKKAIYAAVVALVVVGLSNAADLTEVKSYAAPNLVAEINTMVGEAEVRLDAIEATGVGNALASGKIIVGSAGGLSAAVDMSGDATIIASGALTLATAGLGDAVAGGGVSTRTEVRGDIVTTVITLGSVVLTPTDGSAEGEGLKIFDPDAGAFTILSAVMNGTVVSSAGIGGNYAVAVGTVTASDAADLTSTEADVIPSTAITVSSAAITTNAFDAVLAAPINMDGTGTTKDFYVNLGIADASMEAAPACTVTFTGTLTLITTKPVDNQ